MHFYFELNYRIGSTTRYGTEDFIALEVIGDGWEPALLSKIQEIKKRVLEGSPEFSLVGRECTASSNLALCFFDRILTVIRDLKEEVDFFAVCQIDQVRLFRMLNALEYTEKITNASRRDYEKRFSCI
mgnify:CR=1 FL=1